MRRKYQGRTFVRETAYVCGDYMDADIYPVFQQPGIRRAKSKPTSAVEASAGPTACRLKSPEYANIAIFYYICIRIHTKEPCVSNRRNSSAG